MSAKPPMIRPVAWLGVLFQLALIALFAFLIAQVFSVREPAAAFFFSALTHAVLYRIMRAVFTAEHRRGISLFRAKKFSEAAPHFEASYQALVRRPWLDRFRWLLLGSAGAMSYREMALCNAAFCYSQSGDGTRATALYKQTLQEFPESSIATAALNMIRSVQQPNATPGNA